jgi:hypothetical protein
LLSYKLECSKLGMSWQTEQTRAHSCLKKFITIWNRITEGEPVSEACKDANDRYLPSNRRQADHLCYKGSVHAAWARSSKSRKYPARGFFQTNRVHAYRGQECHFPPHTPHEVEFLATADALARELESGAFFDVEVVHDDRYVPIVAIVFAFKRLKKVR